MLKVEIDSQELLKLITNITKMTICTKLRSFQYRLLTNALTTNKQLKIYGIRDEMCTFCNEQVETVQHLLWTCKYVQEIWLHCSTEFKLGLLNFRKIICNNIDENPINARNTIVLIVKQYIYKTRCLKERLSVTASTNYVKSYVEIEKEIAKQKQNHHEHKWQHYIE